MANGFSSPLLPICLLLLQRYVAAWRPGRPPPPPPPPPPIKQKKRGRPFKERECRRVVVVVVDGGTQEEEPCIDKKNLYYPCMET